MNAEVLFQITTEDAEAVKGRKLELGEASALRKTLEAVLAEDTAYALSDDA
jgi:hypothetical protein